MGMKLSTTCNLNDIDQEPQRYSFLNGVDRSKLIRIDEVHPSEDNDAHYLWMIWCQPEFTFMIEKKIKRNLALDPDLGYIMLPHTGDGLIIFSEWIAS